MIAAPAGRAFRQIPVVPVPDDYLHNKPACLARLALAHGPVFALDWSHGRAVYLVGPEANRFVLQTHREHFSHEQGWSPILGEIFGHGLLTMDGEEHARHRKMMNPAFAAAYMARYLPIMTRVIEERTREWPRHEQVDLYVEARKITFDVAAETLAGLRTGAEVDRLREWFFALLYADFDPQAENEEAFFGRMLNTRELVNGRLLPLFAARRAAAAGGPPDDVLGMLLQARDDQGQALSDEQLLAHIYILLVAGHETSTSLAAWLLYLLATHPAYLARVHRELDAVLGDGPLTLEALKGLRLLGNALTEASRLHAPVAIAPRGVVSDLVFAGYTIPAGTRLYYSPAGSHRLPHIFADPGRFDPDRFAPPREEDKRTPYALVPFGGGPRICIGVNMATVEIKALAAHVLRAYTITPLSDEVVQVYYGVTGTLPDGIRVRVTPRA